MTVQSVMWLGRQTAPYLLIAAAVAAVAGVFAYVDPVPQWPAYHRFADTRSLWGIPNVHNVLSNLGLLLVGAWGTAYLLGAGRKAAAGPLRGAYAVFFAGLALAGLGSAWYHLSPDNQSLVWDRLPMAVMFMGFFASVVGELAGPRVARVWLAPLLAIGVASVLWWAWTEAQGAGDLRAYGLVQFLPPLLIVLMLLAYPAPRQYAGSILAVMLLYGLAKLCEHFDGEIYETLGAVGGHALKHLVSAVAALPIVVHLFGRRHQPGRAAEASEARIRYN